MGRAASPYGLAKSVNADSIALPTGGVSPDAAAVRVRSLPAGSKPEWRHAQCRAPKTAAIIVTDQACDKTHDAGETYLALRLLNEHHSSKELHSQAVFHAQPGQNDQLQANTPWRSSEPGSRWFSCLLSNATAPRK